MTTFKQFLVEQTRSQPIEPEQAVQFIKQHCSQYIKTGNWIYRGVKADHLYMYGDSSQSTRRSAYVPNYGTLIIDNLSSWKQFPKRSRSFICTSSVFYAEEYGNPYLVMIPDQTKIGVVNDEDIQMPSAFPELEEEVGITLDMFNVLLSHLDSTAETKISSEQSQQSYQALKEYVTQAAQNIDTLRKTHYKHQPFIESTVRFLNLVNHYGVDQILSELFDPQTNNFKLVQASSIPKLDNNEVWFSGPAVFIQTEDDGQLSKEIKERL